MCALLTLLGGLCDLFLNFPLNTLFLNTLLLLLLLLLCLLFLAEAHKLRRVQQTPMLVKVTAQEPGRQQCMNALESLLCQLGCTASGLTPRLRPCGGLARRGNTDGHSGTAAAPASRA